jgi:hypothetical protein
MSTYVTERSLTYNETIISGFGGYVNFVISCFLGHLQTVPDAGWMLEIALFDPC